MIMVMLIGLYGSSIQENSAWGIWKSLRVGFRSAYLGFILYRTYIGLIGVMC